MKRPLTLVMLCAILASFSAKAQYAADATQMRFRASTQTLTYISGATDVSATLAANDATVDVPIGFTFNYLGTDYTSVRASSNGWLSFIAAANSLPANASGGLTTIAPAVMPLWDDLNGAAPAKASYVTTGSQPNRVFIFEWKEWGYNFSSVARSITFQVLLYENGGKYGNIEYRYKKETNPPPGSTTNFGATIGIARTSSNWLTLNNTSTAPTPSSSTFTTNIIVQPFTDQSYFFGCVNITSHPADRLACGGSDATMSIAATDADSFQWQVDKNTGTFVNIAADTDYADVNTATLKIMGVTADLHNYKYRCIVGRKGAGGCGIFSNAATLTMTATAPAITVQPAATVSICVGSSNTINVDASGSNVTYQWQVDNGSGFSNISNGSLYSGVTTKTLTITNPGMAHNGLKYRAVVNGLCAAAPLISDTTTLTVNPTPTPEGQPVNRIICAGATTTFSVTSGVATTFKWQEDKGSGFADLANSAPYGGVATATLTLSSVPVTMTGYKYRCVLGTPNCTATSNVATLTVNNVATAITMQPPATKTICAGSTTTLDVTAVGGNLLYQWQIDPGTGYTNVPNNPPYSGATTPTLTITNIPVSLNNAKYRCVIAGTCAPTNVTSNETQLTVNPAPANLDAPVNAVVCAGKDTSFRASATGAVSYRWQVDMNTSTFVDVTDDANHDNVTTTLLSIVAPTGNMNGWKYRMVSTSANSCETNGSVATLTVNTPPAITAEPTDNPQCNGMATSLTVGTTGSPLNFKWQVDDGSGFADITDGSTYTGSSTNTLNIAAADALNGYKYLVKITGVCPRDTISDTVTLTVHPQPVITLTPLPTAICVGGTTTFTGNATGAATYRWQVATATGAFGNINNGGTSPNYSGATTTALTITNAPSGLNNNRYRLVATSAAGCVTNSVHGTLTMNTLPTISTNIQSSRVICAGENTTFSVSTSGTGLTFQWQEDKGSGFANVANGGVYSGATTGTLTLTAAPVSMNGYQYRVIVSGTCSPSVNSNVGTLTVNALPTIVTQPANSTVCIGVGTTFTATVTGATVFRWQTATSSSSTFSTITSAGTPGYADFNDNTTLKVNTPTAAVNGNKYRIIAVSAAGCSTIAATHAVLTVNGPNITTQPSNRFVCEMQDATFSLASASTPANAVADTFRWQVNYGSGYVDIVADSDYADITTNTLKITGATLAGPNLDNSKYRVIVGNKATGCFITSGEATLIINNLPPTVATHPQTSRVICETQGTTFGPVAGSPAPSEMNTTFQWQVNTGSGFNNLSNGAPYSGVTTATLTISNAPLSLNGNKYRCLINGTCGTDPVPTNEGQLTVDPIPTIVSQPVNHTICAPGNIQFAVVSPNATVYQWQQALSGSSTFVDIPNSSVYSGANTATLTITGATLSYNGYKYRCVVGNAACPSVLVSSEATLTTHSVTTAITSQPPASVVVCQGTTTTAIRVSTAGDNVTHQWQVNSGSGWTNLANGAPYSNVTTAIMTITSTPLNLHGNKYRCVVTGTCAPTSITSTECMLTVNALPVNVDAPKTPATVCAGTDTAFLATSTGATTYQWQINRGPGFVDLGADANHLNVHTNKLKIMAPTGSMHGYQYRLIQSSAAGCSTTSAPGTLNVNTPPAIVTEPVHKAACIGAPVSFSIVVTGSSLTYKWQEDKGTGFVDMANGGIYSGTTTHTMTISAPTAAMNGYKYLVKIAGVCPRDTISDTAILTVNPVPSITTNPSDQTICAGDGTTFAAAASSIAATYKWQVDKGSGFTDVAADANHSGVTSNSLIISNATAGMNGWKYRLVAISATGCSVNSSSAVLNINTSPNITTQPANRTGCTGQNVSFNVAVSGAGLTYQWQQNSGSGFTNIADGGIYSGATTNTLTLTGLTSAMNNYEYRVQVAGTCAPGVLSNAALLIVNLTPVATTPPANSTICDGGNTGFSAAITGAVSYRWQLDPATGTFANISDNSTYAGATTQALSITGATTGMNNYKYRITATSSLGCVLTTPSATLAVLTPPNITSQPVNRTVCEGNGTTFSVSATGGNIFYQWQEDPGTGTFGNITNGGAYADAQTSTLTISGAQVNMNGYKYRCVVGGACPPTATSSSATLTVQAAPVITGQPKDSTVCAGTNVTFSVTATGAGLTYQWEEKTGATFNPLQNNGNYSGVDQPTLIISNPGIIQNGYEYRCVIVGACAPDVISNSAKLTVNAYTVITQQPAAATVTCETIDAQIKLTATGSQLYYQWQHNTGSGFTDIAPTDAQYGNINSGTLTIKTPTVAISGRTFRCRVNGVCGGEQISSVSTLTVNSFPSISVHPGNATVREFNDTVFIVSATGTNLGYQWQVNDGFNDWENLFDNAAHDGTKGPILTIKDVPFSKNGYQYRCIATGNCPSDTSDPALLTVISLTENVGRVTAGDAGVTLYPNPVSGNEIILKIEKPGSRNISVKITDQLGKVVKQADIVLSQQNTSSIDISALAPGIYNMHVVSGDDDMLNTIIRFHKQQ